MWNGDFSNLVDQNGNRLTIYDPATTRPNPNGTGFIRDPFPNNQIPVSRFSQLAKNYVATRAERRRPEPGRHARHVRLHQQQLPGRGRAPTKDTTHKFSIKSDHS